MFNYASVGGQPGQGYKRSRKVRQVKVAIKFETFYLQVSIKNIQRTLEYVI